MVSQSGLWHSRRVLTPFWLALCQLHLLVNPPSSSACISRSFFATFAYFCLKKFFSPSVDCRSSLLAGSIRRLRRASSHTGLVCIPCPIFQLRVPRPRICYLSSVIRFDWPSLGYQFVGTLPLGVSVNGGDDHEFVGASAIHMFQQFFS